MTEREIIRTGLILLIIGIISIAITLVVIANQPKNCWDQWHTEQSAIQHCEIHKL